MIKNTSKKNLTESIKLSKLQLQLRTKVRQPQFEP